MNILAIIFGIVSLLMIIVGFTIMTLDDLNRCSCGGHYRAWSDKKSICDQCGEDA